MFWRRSWSNSGMVARTWSTRLCCCATSSWEAVPASNRCLISVSTRLAASKFCRAIRSRSCAVEHQEIGVADRCDGRKHDHLLVEAGGDGGLLRGARGGAVLAPEIDLVAGVERGLEHVALRAARRPHALREAGEIDFRQQRRADDLGLRVGLHDASNGCRDVEIGGLRLLDQIGQLARAKAAPPIERGRRRFAIPGAVFGRDVGGEVGPLGA